MSTFYKILHLPLLLLSLLLSSLLTIAQSSYDNGIFTIRNSAINGTVTTTTSAYDFRATACFINYIEITVPDTNTYQVTDLTSNSVITSFNKKYEFSGLKNLRISRKSNGALLLNIQSVLTSPTLISKVDITSPRVNLLTNEVTLCEKEEVFSPKLNIYLSVSDQQKLDSISDYDPDSAAILINGLRTSKRLFSELDYTKMKDGDLLSKVIYRKKLNDNWNRGCYNIAPDSISTPQYKLKKIINEVIPEPIISTGNTDFCPGDTVMLSRTTILPNIYWVQNNYFLDSSLTRTSVHTGVYKLKTYQWRPNGCYAVSDTVELKRGVCDDIIVLRGVVYQELSTQQRYGFTQGEDITFSNVLLQIKGTDHYAFTNAQGVYTFRLPSDFKIPFEVGIVDSNYYRRANLVRGFFDGYEGRDIETYPLASADLSLNFSGGRARPGFQVPLYLNIQNKGKSSNSGTVTVILDTSLKFDSASVDPVYIDGATLRFSVPELPSSATEYLKVYTHLDAKTPLGKELRSTATVEATKGDIVAFNNFETFSTITTGSFDPNDIAVSPAGEGVFGIIKDTTSLTYTIRFQNTGSDTAFTVMVKDRIPHTLDFSTFTMKGSSHPFEIKYSNDTATWIFNHIMLPYQSVNDAGSQGHLTYSLQQKSGNVPGTEITNQAHIYFDFNDPISTNTVLNTIEYSITESMERNHAELLFINNLEGNKVAVHCACSGKLTFFNSLGSVSGIFHVSPGITELELKTKDHLLFYRFEGKEGKSGKYVRE